MAEKDYKYTLDFLERLNQSIFQTDNFFDMLTYKDYNVWFFFQSSIFSEVKEYSSKKEVPVQKNLSIKGFAVSLVLLIFTMCSLVWFFLRKKKVLIFGVDSLTSKYKSDYRMESLYKFLHAHSIDFYEIFHTVPTKNSLKKFLKRARPAIYLESIDFLFFLRSKVFGNKQKPTHSVALELFLTEEKKFAEFCINKYLNLVPLAIFRIKAFEKVLQLSGTKTVLAIDDTRYYNELLVAARSSNIPTIAFQHGHYTKYHVGCLKQNMPGLPVHPRTLCVWSEYWLNELVRLNSVFPPSSIFITGQNFSASQVRMGSVYDELDRDSGDINVLVPHETDAPKDEVHKFISTLYKTKGVKIIFKIRPNIDKQEQLKEYGIEHFDIQIARNLSDIINKIDVVGGVYSTILYDMVALEKPVFVMETSMDYGEGMVTNELAEKIGLENLETRIFDIAKTPATILHDRKEKILGINPDSFNNSLEKLFKEYSII